ncbi:MAG: Gfo/Idh/MocA family oxidoreductase [Chloroflexi bacterium]|nr:Gfo/Idh/MocA family oxidoreductase [Chloroflexota bacterium]
MMQLNVGFVGVGNRARAHLQALDSLGRTRVVAVVDAVAETARAMAAQLGTRAYPDVGAMLAAEHLDAVYVAVPYHMNTAVAVPILQARVPLFIEKTLAVTPADAHAIATAAAVAGVPTAVGYQWRYLETVDRLQAAVPSERVAMLAGQYYSGPPRTRWGRESRFYAGQVYAQLTHVLDLSRYIAGDVQTVQAAYSQRIWPPSEREPDFDIPDVSALLCRYASGAVGSFHCTHGLGGKLGPGEVVELRVVARDELWVLTNQHLRRLGTDGTTDEWAREGDPVVRMHATFLEAVTIGRPELVRSPISDALQSALVCAAANQANATGQTVACAAL